MTYLGIECDSLRGIFTIPQERIAKYLPILQDLMTRQWVSFAELEKLVGKLVSLECAVPAGMWYTRTVCHPEKIWDFFFLKESDKREFFFENYSSIKGRMVYVDFLPLREYGCTLEAFSECLSTS